MADPGFHIGDNRTGWRDNFSAKFQKNSTKLKTFGSFERRVLLGASVSLGFPTNSSIIRARFVKLVEAGVLDPGRGVNLEQGVTCL